MIKKIIACLTICFIITGIISPVFSDASALPQPNWNDPGISEIINISDLTGWMLNGGTYDVSTYTDAESFMNDYYTARTKIRLESSDYQVKSSFGLEQQYYAAGDSAYANDLDINRVIASSYKDHSGYGRRFSEQVNDALLSTGNLYDTKIPLLNEIEFANFVGYNHDALRIYSSIFADIAPDIPIPDPDPIYSFISNINNVYWRYNEPNLFDVSFFKIRNYSYDGYNDVANSGSTSFSNFTLVGDDFSTNHTNNTGIKSSVKCSLYNGIMSIYITTTNGINVTYSNETVTNTSPFYRNSYDLTNLRQSGIYYACTMYYNNSDTVMSYKQSSFDGLSQCLNYIYQHYANINLYVDGKLWVLSGDPVIPPYITPEFPDAVGGAELPNTTWPIFRPRAPYYTNVPGVLQAIEDAIADDGQLDIDDLKPYLTDENGDPVPDPIFDPEPVPIPVPDPVNPDVVPGLPVLPAIPPEMPGFNGVSVLAEIINFTNQSLPTSLIVTFWGIVFGIVILGLIKILHK